MVPVVENVDEKGLFELLAEEVRDPLRAPASASSRRRR